MTDLQNVNPPALTPYSFDELFGRIAHEWESRQRIVDLPNGRFWSKDKAVDITMEFRGRPAAAPVGPAKPKDSFPS